MNMIEIHNLRKQFRTHRYKTNTLKQKFLSFFHSRYVEDHRDFWVLDDINLTIARGEFFGVMGPNGSGKTTLLCVVAGTIPPTEGDIRINGRIAPMIEIGLGFNQELTGRENVYLNASLFGLSKDEIDAIYGEVVDFAELGDFIDSPLRYYSTGMTARLAFSISVHLDADILLVDEFMAVGDAHFSKKCLQKMLELKSGGRSVLFVSHNLPMIDQVCDRAGLLIGGKMIDIGETGQVIHAYNQYLNGG